MTGLQHNAVVAVRLFKHGSVRAVVGSGDAGPAGNWFILDEIVACIVGKGFFLAEGIRLRNKPTFVIVRKLEAVAENVVGIVDVFLRNVPARCVGENCFLQ